MYVHNSIKHLQSVYKESAYTYTLVKELFNIVFSAFHCETMRWNVM